MNEQVVEEIETGVKIDPEYEVSQEITESLEIEMVEAANLVVLNEAS